MTLLTTADGSALVDPSSRVVSAVVCEGLCYSFQEREVLRHLDLEVCERSSVAIVGPSGSGKTTLLHILAGLLQANSGEVKVAGLDLRRASRKSLAHHRRHSIGMVFQFGELIPELTVAENVALPLLIRGDSPDDDRICELIKAVGLRDPEAVPAQLSGGELQRAAVARALVTSPDVLLCDEPTGCLDAARSEVVTQLLVDATHRIGATLLVATHDAAVASRMDRVLLLDNGHLRSVAGL